MSTLSFQTVQLSPRFGAVVPLEDALDSAAGAGSPAVGLDLWSFDTYAATGGDLAGIAGAIERRALRCTDVVALALRFDGDGALLDARRLAALGNRLGATTCPSFAPR